MKNLMNKSLTESRDEIREAFQVMESDSYKMKLAVLMMFILESALKVLKGIDCQNFMDEVKVQIDNMVKEVEDWKQSETMLKEHIEKNGELVSALDLSSHEIRKVADDIAALVKRYDELISSCAEERDKKSIAEIESSKI